MHCELDRAVTSTFLGPKARDTTVDNISTFTSILSKLFWKIYWTRETHLAICEIVLL